MRDEFVDDVLSLNRVREKTGVSDLSAPCRFVCVAADMRQLPWWLTPPLSGGIRGHVVSAAVPGGHNDCEAWSGEFEAK
jgi:hypothetical protein